MQYSAASNASDRCGVDTDHDDGDLAHLEEAHPVEQYQPSDLGPPVAGGAATLRRRATACSGWTSYSRRGHARAALRVVAHGPAEADDGPAFGPRRPRHCRFDGKYLLL